MTDDEKRERRRRQNKANADRVKASRERYKKAHPERVRELRRQQNIRYRQRNAAKARATRRASDHKRYWRDPERERAKKATTQRRAAKRHKAAMGRRLHAAALAALPAALPRHVRDDIAAALVVLVLERKVTEAEMPRRARRLVNDHYRLARRDLSLDSGTRDGRPLHDFIGANENEQADYIG